MTKPLYTGLEWNEDLLKKGWVEIEKIAAELKLDYYPVEFQLIGYEQMLEIQATSIPGMYNHWSFGKSYIEQEKGYRAGRVGLAYEVIFNTVPTIAYIMDQNTMTCQMLVMAHSAVGHGGFFKQNYLFKEHTNAEFIVQYLDFARKFIEKCERDYGPLAVEAMLDACHVLQLHSVDKFRRRHHNKDNLEIRKRAKAQYEAESFDEFWETLKNAKTETKAPLVNESDFETMNEENLLYFIEKHSASLKPWQRELCRIVRTINQYFYPQRLTKMMNEGYATWTHYKIMTMLADRGIIDSGSYLEFLDLHCGVVPQRDWDTQHYSGMNPYAIGFAMFQDIERICKEPTEEDRQYFDWAGTEDYLSVINTAMTQFNDESFILQYLSPKLMRDFKLMMLEVDSVLPYYKVGAIQSETDYNAIRKAFSLNYNMYDRYIPRIEIEKFNKEKNIVCINTHIKEGRGLITKDFNSFKTAMHYLLGDQATLIFDHCYME